MANNKKCPAGVICIENVTFVIIIIILFVFGYLIYKNISPNKTSNQNVYINEKIEERNSGSLNRGFGWFMSPNYPYTNLPGDTLYNPLVPPLRDERYIVSDMAFASPPGRVPINVSTSAVETNYRQIGILTPLNNNAKDNILQLMGRPLYVRRSKYQYYAISNQHNNVKLPIIVKGRTALNDNGVDELYTGDRVYVEGYQESFKVTKYEDNTIKYLPFI
jgi:hypothetical protein